jgi:hypothetical protein
MSNKAKLLCTPLEYLPLIQKHLGNIFLDPCGNPNSPLDPAIAYNLPGQDGLALPWSNNVYCNPPWGYDYETNGTEILTWLSKGVYENISNNCRILFLLPYVPKATWWKLLTKISTLVIPIENSSTYFYTPNSSPKKIPVCFALFTEQNINEEKGDN